MNAAVPLTHSLQLDFGQVTQHLEATISLSGGLNEIIHVKQSTQCPVHASPQEIYIHINRDTGISRKRHTGNYQ